MAISELLLTFAASALAFICLAAAARWWRIALGLPLWGFVIGGAIVCTALGASLNIACAFIPPVLMAGLLAGQRLFSN